MSGMMRYRENRAWLDAIQTGDTLNRVFWEFLNFFADHPNIDIISYGTGTTESGTSTPTAWLTWDDPVPWGENSWFVIEAQLASASLNGDGSRKWQAKFQVANGVGFDDTSGSDYDNEGTTGIVCVRFSPDGGWVGGATRDFSGVTASNNIRIARAPAANEGFNMHIAGDDDTVGWVGMMDDDGLLPNYLRQRFGYMGELQRRNGNHSKPELFFADEMYDGTAAICGKRSSSSTYVFSSSDTASTSPSFSLADDDSAVEGDGSHVMNAHYSSTTPTQQGTGPDDWSGDDEFIGILVRQNSGSHNSILGQLRLFVSADERITEGNLMGGGDYISVGYQTASYTGIGFPWPGSGTIPDF